MRATRRVRRTRAWQHVRHHGARRTPAAVPLLLLLCAAGAAGRMRAPGGRTALSLLPPSLPLPAVNWAAASLGATATANSAGYWVRRGRRRRRYFRAVP
jgi:hypothetical protein